MILLFVIADINIVFDPKIYYTKVTLLPGLFAIDCYGAQGGGGYIDGYLESNGGKGAHTHGILNVTADNLVFYAYVGGKGTSSQYGPNMGGYNGGGNSGKDTEELSGDCSGSGGGASDIRIGVNDLKHRIMVAAGGSGGAGDEDGAPGGDTVGRRKSAKGITSKSTNTTQNAGNSNGVGGKGCDSIYTPGSGGGGGYRGGVFNGVESGYNEGFMGFGDLVDYYKSVAESGSSYISGHPGLAVTENVKFTNTSFEVGARFGNGKIDFTTIYRCPVNCSSCESSTTCFSCHNNALLYKNKCYLTCPKGTIKRGKTCMDCASNCDVCLSEGTCSKCKANYYLYNSKCYYNCTELNNNALKQYYGKNTQKQTCQKCSVSNCISCQNDYSKCTSCSSGYIYEESSNKCVIKLTKAFSPSSTFSNSNQFSSSLVFSNLEMNSPSTSSEIDNSSIISEIDSTSTSSSFSEPSDVSNSLDFSESHVDKTETFDHDEIALLEVSVSDESREAIAESSESTKVFSAATQIESPNTKMPTDLTAELTIHSTTTRDLISIDLIEKLPSSKTLITHFSSSFNSALQSSTTSDGDDSVDNENNMIIIIVVIIVVIITLIIASFIIFIAIKYIKKLNLIIKRKANTKSVMQDKNRNTVSDIEQIQDNSDQDLNFWL